jgi:hypothetical protein
LGEEYRLLSSSLCSFLYSLVISFLLGPNIILNTIFSNTLSLCFSLSVSDQVSNPYKNNRQNYSFVFIYPFTPLYSVYPFTGKTYGCGKCMKMNILLFKIFSSRMWQCALWQMGTNGLDEPTVSSLGWYHGKNVRYYMSNILNINHILE